MRAERCYRQAIRVVDERTNPLAARFALNNLAVTRCLRGDDAGAREVFKRVLASNERVGDLYDIAVAHNNVAEIELRLGEARSASEHARRAVSLGERIAAHADLPDFYRNLAEACAALGDLDGGVELSGKALVLAEQGGGRVYLAQVAVTLARILRDASKAPSDATCRRVASATAALKRVLEARGDAPELREAVEACKGLLGEGADG